MVRSDPRHKALVDAVVDAEDEAAALAKEAAEGGPRASEALKKLARRLVSMCAAGKLPHARARELWVEAFRGSALAAFAGSAQRALDSAEAAADGVAAASRSLGADVVKVDAVRAADFRERADERSPRDG